MEQINDQLTDFSRYDINYVNQLIDFFNLASADDLKQVQNNIANDYGNISLLPNDLEDLKLLEFSRLRNYYTEPPNIKRSQNSDTKIKFYAYNYDGNKIYFESRISGPNYDNVRFDTISYSADESCSCNLQNSASPNPVNNDRNVYTGTLNKIPVTIEWLPATPDDPTPILNEMATWDQLSEKFTESPTLFPLIKTDYSFYGLPVLIKERLIPLDRTDWQAKQVYILGTTFLEEFKILHTLGILNNLSPNNIGKDIFGNYKVVDYSSLATTPLFYGFKREYWSNVWSSQVPETNQVTTAKNDLLELGYLMNYLLTMGEMSSQLPGAETMPEYKLFAREIEPSRSEKLYRYMQEIKKSESFDGDYDGLIKILS